MGLITRHRRVGSTKRDLGSSAPAQRQRQVNHRVLQVFSNFQRGRRIVVEGEFERRSIGQYALRRHQADLSQRQHVGVQGQFRKAPKKRLCCMRTGLNQKIQVTFLLLEMLRPQKHAFRPHHLALPDHGFTLFPVGVEPSRRHVKPR